MSESIDKVEDALWIALRALETLKNERQKESTPRERLVQGKEITSAQCRAGRGLLFITGAQLASASGTTGTIVSRLENGIRVRDCSPFMDIRRAMEERGVVFYADGSLGLGEKK
jgi:hypothetical protein